MSRTLLVTHAKKATSKKSCLTCRYFLKCPYPSKSHKYRCESWKQSRGLKAEVERAADVELKNLQTYDLNFEFDPTKENQTKQFEKALSELLKNEAAVTVDIRVNDSEMPLAKNFLEFCSDKRFLGFKPFAKQLQAGLHLFNEICPYCSDPEWFEDIPFKASVHKIKRKLCLLENGVCPECKRDRARMIRKHRLKDYFELILQFGQRSGKSIVASMISAYSLHHYLKVQNPAVYFDQLPNTVLHGTFVGLTYNGSKELLYDPFYNLLADSPWFQDYHALLREAETRLGEEIYKFKDTFVHYRHRNLMVYPQGPNRRTLRGRTRFMGGIDEIGLFDAEANKDLVKLSAHEIYKSMGNSFQTLRAASRRLRRQGLVDIPKPIFFNISSPLSQLDMINTLYRRSQRSKSNLYGMKLATWEANPQITFDDLEEERESDPVGFWRDFGCEPALSRSTFIADIKDIAPSLKSSNQNAARLRPRIQKSKSGRTMMTGKLRWQWRDKRVPKLMSLDAGAVSNSFAVVVAHNEIDRVTEEIVTVYDLFLELIPSKAHPISFTWVYEDILVPVCEELGVTMVVSDRWQNLKLLSDLEEQLDVDTEQYSLKYEDFIGFKNSLIESRIRFPRPKVKSKLIPKTNLDEYPDCFSSRPVDHFVLQCLTVEDIPGKSVSKGEVTTDDLFRAAVLNHAIITDPDFCYRFSGDAGIKSRGGIIAISDPAADVSSVTGIGAAVSMDAQFN